MYSIQEAKEEAVLQLLSWDCPINADMVAKVLKDWIRNCWSHIGEEYHKTLTSLGVKDLTGMTMEEHNAQSIELARDYEEALKDVEKGNDNWKEIEERMLKWALEH